jgi:Fic family protein
MARLVNELQSTSFAQAHPVVQAAYAHYAYVCIHPFTDGNGRVARALASVYLYRNPGVPLVIFADQRDIYIDALEEADAGHPQAFVQFISQRAMDTIGLIELSLQETTPANTSPITDAQTQETEIRQLTLAGERLADLCAEHLREALTAYQLPSTLKYDITISHFQDRVPINGQTLLLPSHHLIRLTAKPSQLIREVVHNYHVDLLGVTDQQPNFSVTNNQGNPLDVWLRDLIPAETTILRMKLDLWAKNAAGKFVERLNGAVRC